MSTIITSKKISGYYEEIKEMWEYMGVKIEFGRSDIIRVLKGIGMKVEQWKFNFRHEIIEIKEIFKGECKRVAQELALINDRKFIDAIQDIESCKEEIPQSSLYLTVNDEYTDEINYINQPNKKYNFRKRRFSIN